MLRVLVREPIADAGIELLRERFDVDVDANGDLAEQIGDYDAIVIRSATKLDADLIGRADRLKVIGRAGVGVDNVDVEAATRRGIVVANAPESTVISAAEHTIGLLLALSRNIPQAHAALKEGRWERSQLRRPSSSPARRSACSGSAGSASRSPAARAGSRCASSHTTRSSRRSAFASSASSAPRRADEVLAAGRLRHPAPAADRRDPRLDRRARRSRRCATAFASSTPRAASCSTKRRCSRRCTPARSRPQRSTSSPRSRTQARCSSSTTSIVTPHLAASTEEAQDRAGLIVAEQVAAALEGSLVTNAVNIPSIGAEDLEILGPFIPLAATLGRLAMELAGGRAERIELAYYGSLSGYDTRLLTVAALNGAFQGRSTSP